MDRVPPSARESCLAGCRELWRGAAFGMLAVILFHGLVSSKAVAGDLLRGGTSYGNTNPAGSAPAASAAQVQARAVANDTLAKTTRALQSVQVMQQSAQQLAAAAAANNAGLNPATGAPLPNVPNGLVPGGLQITGAPTGASLPRQSGGNGGVTVTVVQNQPQAILNWSSFNVGKNTTLYFNQTAGGASASQWIAFNKVTDPTGVPSQILGSIKAEGQVYIINQNGIIFGAGSQVNVHTLVASSLPIDDNLISRGLLNNPDAQFLFSSIAQPSGTKGPTSAYTPPAAPNTPNGQIGDVIVQAGAMLTSPASAASVGGRIALIGPNVSNAGTISTPDGQTILAAGLQVGFAAHASSDPSLRGLDVYVGAVVDPSSKLPAYAGTASNTGYIYAPEGNTYITGKNVNQLGVINSSTSVSLNGRIDLLANYNAVSNLGYDATIPNPSPGQEPFLFQSTGNVTLGANSVTQILPELTSAATIIPSVNNGVAGLAIPSQVNLQGLTVHLAKDAVIYAPNANVNVQAGTWRVIANGTGGGNVLFLNSAGQIYLDSGATIDVSGSEDVSAPISQNIIQAQLRGAELADSSLQQNGPLRGTTVTVDVRETGVYNGVAWVGSPIGNLFGYASAIQQTVGELTVNGGSVTLNAGNSVVVQKGATINVSGGWINYAGGMVQTTRVVTADGHILDISQATPDIQYAGIYSGTFTQNHAAWGVSNTYTTPFMLGTHYEQAYSYGGNGGSISITAPSMALDGNLLGVTVTGPRQQNAAPLSSSLSLSFKNQQYLTSPEGAFSFSPTPPSVTFQTNSNQAAVAPFALDADGNPLSLRSDRVATVLLSPDLLTKDGFGYLSVDNSDGNILVPAGVVLQAPPGGSVSLKGANITVNGSISAPAGNINLTVSTISPYTAALLSAVSTTGGTAVLPSPDPTRGLLTLGSGASLDAAGLIIDNRRSSPNALTLPQAIATSTVISGDIVAGSTTVTLPLNPGLSVGEKVSGPGIPAGTTIVSNGTNSAGSETVLTLSSAATVTAAGLPLSFAGTVNSTTNGGTIAINSYSANLQAGSVLNVSGGVLVSPTGKTTYGNGGSIIINTGIDPNIAVLGGTLNLGATLLGYSGAKGGSLSIQAQQIEIGAASLSAAVASSSNIPEAPPLVLSPDFFSEGGFSSFTLTGLGTGIYLSNTSGGMTAPAAAIEIAPHTVITPVMESVVATFNVPGHASVVLQPVVEPVGMRTPVSLSFVANGVTDPFQNLQIAAGNFVMGEGAVIRTDPRASISVNTQTISILGSITTPGGSITLKGASTFPNGVPSLALPTVYLGPQSVLSTAGTVVYTPNAFGQLTGTVLSGGAISVSGNIVAMAGALLDVSGTSAPLDVAPASLNLNAQLNGPLTSPVVPVNSGINFPLYSHEVVRTQVDSNGGTISLKGAQELFTDATLLGAAGGPTAVGGTLFISSGRLPTSNPLPSDINLVVTQHGPTIPASFSSAGQTGVGSPVLDASGKPVTGMGYFAVDSFQNGGFDSLSLGGNVDFVGPVSIIARNAIQVATGGYLYANSRVNLTAPYVELGTPFQAPIDSLQVANPFTLAGKPYDLPPTYGPGVLTVHANYIDVGNLSLQGIGNATLVAANGDIRGDGTLDIQGNLVLAAAQVYPSTEVNFTIVAYDYTSGGVTHPGSITVLQSGVAQTPLSAAGDLNIYASIIRQQGTLVAPFGVINLGYDGKGPAPTDLLAGPYTPLGSGPGVNTTTPFPITQQLVLGNGSVTSVAGIDLSSGLALTVPYGLNLNGTQWIDPSGTDISAAGVPLKSINIQGQNVSTAPTSQVSIQGGGDLFAYRFVPGQGGSTDILSSSNSYAVIPGFQSLISPYGTFNAANNANNNFIDGTSGQTIVTDQGYVNSTIKPGSQIYLSGSSALSAGVYTLLPARYALLPGGVLVTPVSGAPVGTIQLPDGSAYVDGSLVNGFDGSSNQFTTRYQVTSQTVVHQKAEYDTFLATTFFPTQQQNLNVPVTRLPSDAGHLVFEGIQGLSLQGQVQAGAPNGGLGGLVDISTPVDIYITGSGVSAPAGTVALSASLLNSWGAESLLIGGVRTLAAGTAFVNVTAGNITVNNAGTPLSAPEIILAANKTLTLDPGAVVSQSGSMGEAADTLFLNGSGTLLRVSSDSNASIFRNNVTNSTLPHMVIGAGAVISGGSVTLDSTYATSLDPTATLSGTTINLDSGQISLVLNNAGPLQPTVGLVLEGPALQSLQSAQNLSLLSYSSIDIYGTGQVGTTSYASLALHAGEIRGFTPGGSTATFQAQNITLDNKIGSPSLGPVAGLSGSLVFDANTVTLGANQLNVDQYQTVTMNAPGGVLVQGAGGFTTQGDLNINTSLLTAAAGSTQNIVAQGAMVIQPTGGASTLTGGLGASLNLQGSSIIANSNITLPSGLLTLHATGGNVTVGGKLDVSGTAQTFYDLIKFTDGGQINLISDTGSVVLNAGGVLNVSAAQLGGNAGTLTVQATVAAGTFVSNGTLLGTAGQNGMTGNFAMDVGMISDFTTLSSALDAGDFTQSRTLRIRNGSITLSDDVVSHNFNLSADNGSITVSSTIDASGVTGGSITLSASGSVILTSSALLTVAGQTFDSAGKGGSVTLEAGADINGVASSTALVDIRSGSRIDLSVGNYSNLATLPSGYQAAPMGDFTGTLHLRAPQNSGATDLQINPINGTITNASSITVEGYKIYDVSSSGGVITTAVQNSISANGNAFAGNAGAIFTRLTQNNPTLAAQLVATATTANPVNAKLLQIVPGAEIINSTNAGTTSLPISLNTNGSSITFDAPATLNFASGTPGGDQITTTSGGTVTTGGVTTSFAAGTMSLAANSTVAFNGPGTVTFSSGSTAIPVTVAAGASTANITTSGSVTTTESATGTMVQLNSSAAAFTLTGTGKTLTLPNGIPTSDRITFTGAGKYVTPAGATVNFATGAAFLGGAIPAGSVVTFTNNGGKVTLTTGTNGALAVLLPSSGTPETFTTTGNVSTTSPTTSIVLGALNTGNSNDWDLSTFRFGTNKVPGVLTLRSSGNLVFYNALSDGFAANGATLGSVNTALVMTQNNLLPTNAQSWSFNLTAGADLSAANVLGVLPAASVGAGGSLMLGRTMSPDTLVANSGAAAKTTKDIYPTTNSSFFQVIRTGTGDINISTAGSTLLLNQFASIYTAGVQVTDPTLGGTFTTPVFFPINLNTQGELGSAPAASYQAQFTLAGGSIVISSLGNIAHDTMVSGVLVADSEAELPTSWLYRRGDTVPTTGLFAVGKTATDIQSTSWWVDFSNFFEGVGALGGGNVTLNAGGNVSNVDAVIPTNARMPGQNATTHQALAPNADSLVELGGGNLTVKTGNNIDAGVYYVERGHGVLNAGGSIITNSTRSPSLSALYFSGEGGTTADSSTWLPTTLFVGDASFDVSARGSVLLGPVANTFLLPSGYGNTFWYKTYFQTYDGSDVINVSSLGGNVTFRESTTLSDAIAPISPLQAWYQNVLLYNSNSAEGNNSNFMPWLRLDENDVTAFAGVTNIMPPSLVATAFSGDINIVGNLTLFPSSTGTIDLAASHSINALQPTGVSTATQFNPSGAPTTVWVGSVINLSDANPSSIANIASPQGYQALVGTGTGSGGINSSLPDFLNSVTVFFGETGSSTGNAAVIQTKDTLHDTSILHLDDPNPIHLLAGTGDISGLTLFSGKAAQIVAGEDITNVSFYIQNVSSSDVSFVSAGRDIITFDKNAPLVLNGLAPGNALTQVNYSSFLNLPQSLAAGDIQISGPGTLEVLAGRNLNLGNTGSTFNDGTGVGITSIGNARNPALPFGGADLVVAAGIGSSFGLGGSQLDFTSFLSQYLTAAAPAITSAGAVPTTSASGGTYLSELSATLTDSSGNALNLTPQSVQQMTTEQQNALALQLLMIVLRDAGRSGDFATGDAAIATLFPKPNTVGDIKVTGREIKTVNGGNLTIVDPAGSVTVGLPGTSAPAADQGIFTVDGGNVGIFTNGSTNVGISRIFTLHGGNITIWSSTGDIDAGASAKTVTAAPPTRVLIDPQSADVQTDLGGLATGGGIGVLATVAGVPPGSVDLIAPVGTVDAGDAGIRATGSVNIAAAVVLNASNISAPSISGAPSSTVAAAPNIALATSANTAAGGGTSALNDLAKQNTAQNQPVPEEAPSIINVEVLGYGGGEEDQ